MATAEELGAKDTGPGSRPVFIASNPNLYNPTTDRELTDQEMIAWRSFQLWRTTLSMERRDKAYHSILNGPSTQFYLAHDLLGTPYPVIEPNPTMSDAVKTVRPYEHGLSALLGSMHCYWLRSLPAARVARSMSSTTFFIGLGTFFLIEMCFTRRAISRLTGFAPNDYECRKYGVVEDKARLERKKELWEKFARYKAEWCRRYDYHVYGIRPGEHTSLFSACWLPPWKVRYGTITDYPMRKNPYLLSETPLHNPRITRQAHMCIPVDENVPIMAARPELKYFYRGPKPIPDSPLSQFASMTDDTPSAT